MHSGWRYLPTVWPSQGDCFNNFYYRLVKYQFCSVLVHVNTKCDGLINEFLPLGSCNLASAKEASIIFISNASGSFVSCGSWSTDSDFKRYLDLGTPLYNPQYGNCSKYELESSAYLRKVKVKPNYVVLPKEKTVSNIDEGLTGNKYKRRYTDGKPLLSRAIYIILWGPGTSIFFYK